MTAAEIHNSKESPLPTWEEFTVAMETFKDDLGIVGHGEKTPISPFDEPKAYGEYSLTQLPADMGEEAFKAQMAGVKKIAITCMDRRVARPLWQIEGGGQGNVLLLAIGGGVVQNEERHKQMEVIAGYLAQFENIKEVVATDHDSNCGAVKKFLADVDPALQADNGLPDLLRVPLGDQKEQAIMAQLIVYGAQPWITAFGQERVKVKDAIVDTKGQTVEMVDIGSDVVPLKIEDLAQQLLG